MIEINNLTNKKIDEDFIRRTAEIALKGEKSKKNTGISFALIGPGRMRKINKMYRGKNKVTDVLSFPGLNVDFGKLKNILTGKIKEEKNETGEAVICLKEVKKNAARFKVTFEEELSRIVIHAVLHLLGYDHEKSKEEAERMKEKEEKYLSEIKK